MTALTTPQRLLMLETIYQLDNELAYYDVLIGRLLQRRFHQRTRRTTRRLATRSVWVREWFLDRPEHGQFRFLMDKLQLYDVAAFKNFTRMEPPFFLHLLEMLRPKIERLDTNYRAAICAGTRLALTLRFYATGESYISLRYNWLVAHNTISKIVRQVSKAIIEVYGVTQHVLMPPIETEGWLKIAKKFSDRWNFHNTLGALDGKHVAIRKPRNSGSLYYNYKGFFSIIMLALVDGDYKFIWVDAGTNGSSSDAQIFNTCELKEMVESDLLGIPPAQPFPGGDTDVPFFFIADDAFALKPWLMKPYSKRDMSPEEIAFNYRLSRGRRIVENAFGILVNRFGCLMTTMRVKPETATDIVLSCCCLHNLLRDAYSIPRGIVDEEDANHNLVPGQYRRESDLAAAGQNGDSGRNTGSAAAKAQRDYMKDYYNSDIGKVEWQDRAVNYWQRD